MRLEQGKLYPPPLHDDAVARRRLIARFEERRPGAVALVFAPAGYGKSTLAAQWLAATVGPRAWLSLDPLDGDPVRLGRYLAAALGKHAPSVVAVGEAIDAGGIRDPREIADALAAALRAGSSGALVVDDAHVLGESSGGNELLTALVERLPETPYASGPHATSRRAARPTRRLGSSSPRGRSPTRRCSSNARPGRGSSPASSSRSVGSSTRSPRPCACGGRAF